MNEEELFCKLFPEYVVNGKPLSPYFDLFESGYEQAENRFEELQERIKTLEYRCENIKDTDTMELVALQRENAELKEDNNARKFAMAMSEKVEKQLRKENAELKAQLERLNGRENCKHKYYELSKGAAVICYNVHSCENCQHTWRTI